MTYATLLTTAAAFLQPPGLLLVLSALGIVLALLGMRFWAASLVLLSMLGLYALSIGPVARGLVLPLEDAYPPLNLRYLPQPSPQAIVVLAGGTVANAPDRGGTTLSARTFARVRAAAQLARATGLPIVVSGGRPRWGEDPEAELMAAALRDEFHVDNPIWMEDKAFNTAQNASRTMDLLERHGIRRIYLVTSALHMPRAMEWFQHVEFQVVPVPTDYRLDRGVKTSWTQWLPRAGYLSVTSEALHEYVGRWWKWLREQAADPEI
ncbi:YdcF family protein [Thermithiobacillus tepidarius DSM 3134]|uniref:YdcF family protein n=1 Tax=Thermithiobacillus tepidarius TaxID=929 RepID=UPI0004211FEA|nr:YdcF family protein [Thermithiobacillus tepidarius]